MFAINFYTQIYEDMLLKGRKTVTIRLGDKSEKYQAGELVWITVGNRFGRRRKLFTAIIDSVTVKRLADVSPREMAGRMCSTRSMMESITPLTEVPGRTMRPSMGP